MSDPDIAQIHRALLELSADIDAQAADLWRTGARGSSETHFGRLQITWPATSRSTAAICGRCRESSCLLVFPRSVAWKAASPHPSPRSRLRSPASRAKAERKHAIRRRARSSPGAAISGSDSGNVRADRPPRRCGLCSLPAPPKPGTIQASCWNWRSATLRPSASNGRMTIPTFGPVWPGTCAPPAPPAIR